MGFGGMKIKTRLAYLDEVWLLDMNHQQQLLQRIVAECAFDTKSNAPLPNALLGIGGGPMRNGGLCLNYADSAAWLVKN